ncbi:MAG: hypothetical protein ACRC7S_20130 [Cetobacterium sp.]
MKGILVIGVKDTNEIIYMQEVYDTLSLAKNNIKLSDSYFELLFNTFLDDIYEEVDDKLFLKDCWSKHISK